ncbi:hypothetical protein [Actinokineospora globicatena]|uniref:hypothetical protein n=1 Tax=Actinokineospora globicatena TaxID=103729 RepID=UPI0020A45F47|nr:hypothetical protein [Actinokineospora globicatena]MCP2301886.1 hypothetical protein [Actinokineospora globicatena]GLW76455.1 hypothetical protein Aglo01_09370 [Actinokineospora globicatena]GLW83290.1 hypothetical protein Aglo02_09300 [Actinokineospora globicatena]
MTLRLDHEAVTALATEVTDLQAAVTAIATYARVEPLTPRHFGPLGARAAAAFTALQDDLLTEIENAAPALENAVSGLIKAAEQVIEVDQDAAVRITRAGER